MPLIGKGEKVRWWTGLATIALFLASPLLLIVCNEARDRHRAHERGHTAGEGVYNHLPAAVAPASPNQEEELEQEQDGEEGGGDNAEVDTRSSSSGHEHTTGVDGTGSAAADCSTESDEDSGPSAGMPAGAAAGCEVDSQANDDDDEGWETVEQGWAPLSNAAMEAAAVRLFGGRGGGTESLLPAHMPSAAYGLHALLHLLITDVFLADENASPHFQLVWDPEDDAMGYVSSDGVACFNAAADFGEPAHDSDASARREHHASRARSWFLFACRLLSQCLAGSHQDLDLVAEVHAQVEQRYAPLLSWVASQA